ncbi:MAG: hypothetical protein ACFE9Q_00270 [Candidatus Hodarchaeota archaeon]
MIKISTKKNKKDFIIIKEMDQKQATKQAEEFRKARIAKDEAERDYNRFSRFNFFR